MNKTPIATAALLSIFLATTASAQPPWAGPGQTAEERLEQQVERMAERLDLTSSQQEEVYAILEAQARKGQAAREAVRAEIDAILTDEQRAVRDERIERAIDRRIGRLADRIDLTDEQATALRSLMIENRGKADWRGGAMREQLATVLTADQLARLDELGPQRGPRNRGARELERPMW